MRETSGSAGNSRNLEAGCEQPFVSGEYRAGWRLRRFRKDRSGAAAVEFAMVGLPFFALLFAIIEVVLIFWSNQVLETAVAETSRRLYTGQFQSANKTLSADELTAKFKDEVCSYVTIVFDCKAMLSVDVRTYANFPEGQAPLPVTPDGEIDAESMLYRTSGPSDIVIVRAAMAYPLYVPVLNALLSDLRGNKRLVMASAAFRNEDFASP